MSFDGTETDQVSIDAMEKINELLEQVKTEQVRLRKAEFELLRPRSILIFYIIRWMPSYGWRRPVNRKRL